MTLVCIRDDDLSFHTEVEELYCAYGEWLDRLPITFFVIPFVAGAFSYMNNLHADNNREKLLELAEKKKGFNALDFESYYSVNGISENHEIVKFIKQKPHLELGVHGVHHSYYTTGPEFLAKKFIVEELKDVQRYVSDTFERNISLFCPPSNTISYSNLSAVFDAGLDLVSSKRVKTENIIEEIEYIFEMAVKNPVVFLKKLIEPGKAIINIKNGSVIASHTFRTSDTAKTFISRVERDAHRFKYLSIATHYHELAKNIDHRQHFFEVLEYMNYSKNYQFSRHDEVVNLLKVAQ